MSDVFISYARSDHGVAAAVARYLESQGFSVWWDRELVAGSDFSAEIERELASARAVIVLWSSAARESSWVRDEAAYARDRHKLVPARLDGAEPPLGFRQLQTLDLPEASGEVHGAQLTSLTIAIQRLLAAPESKSMLVSNLPGAGLSRAWGRPVASISALLVAVGIVVGVVVWLRPIASEPIVTSDAPTVEPATAVEPEPAISEKSIAVLPFADMSPGRDQEYLADGMADEIINILAQAPDLRVPARTSSFYFKDKATTIPEIGRTLAVAHVLEGSVRLLGDRLRVTAQLVRTDNGYHVWSDRYDRAFADIFQVQDEIANAVAQALQIKLMGGELDRTKGGTRNLEAYRLWLKASNAAYGNSKASIDEAVSLLREATKLDPNFGLAWSYLAFATILQTDSGFLAPSDGYERVRRLARKALELSPDLATAHSQLAWVHLTYDWDWRATEVEIERGLALDRSNVGALITAGSYYATMGRWADAEHTLRVGLDRDPLNTLLLFHLQDVYLRSGRVDEAETVCRKLLEIAPDFRWARHALEAILLESGRAAEALEVANLETDPAVRLLFLPTIYAAMGRAAEAEEALKSQKAVLAESDAFYIAMSYGYRGDRDAVFYWLERAYQRKEPDFRLLRSEPLLRSVAGDVRFEALLRRLNLPALETPSSG